MSIRDDNSVESPSIVGFTFDEKHIKRESEGSDLDNTSIVTPRRVNENHIKSETGVDKNAFWRTCFKLIKDVGDQIKNIEYDYERQLPLGSYNGCQPQTKSADEAIEKADLVYLACPPTVREIYAIKTLELGKALFLEKPFGCVCRNFVKEAITY